jgi:hypothetical protein
MNFKKTGIVAVLATSGLLMTLPVCGQEQELERKTTVTPVKQVPDFVLPDRKLTDMELSKMLSRHLCQYAFCLHPAFAKFDPGGPITQAGSVVVVFPDIPFSSPQRDKWAFARDSVIAAKTGVLSRAVIDQAIVTNVVIEGGVIKEAFIGGITVGGQVTDVVIKNGAVVANPELIRVIKPLPR